MKYLKAAALSFLVIVAACRKKIDPVAIDAILDAHTELHCIDARGTDTIIAAGGSRYGHGDIFVTRNGGESWDTLLNAADKGLYGVHIADETSMYACGYDGKFLQSHDAGATWTLTQEVFQPLHCVFVRNDHVYLAGGDAIRTGLILNGANLNPAQLDTFPNELRAILPVGDSIVFASGYGLIMRSNDNGLTWKPTSAEGDFFVGLAFDSARHNIYAAGMNGTVLATNNNKDWVKVKGGNNPANISTLWNAIDGNNLGLALGGENGHLLYYPYADGKWERVKTNFDEDISGVSIVNNFIFCSTSQGKVYRVELP